MRYNFEVLKLQAKYYFVLKELLALTHMACVHWFLAIFILIEKSSAKQNSRGLEIWSNPIFLFWLSTTSFLDGLQFTRASFQCPQGSVYLSGCRE